MTEPASTSPSQAQQSQQSSSLREMRETQETPGAQENQPTQEPSAHQEEQPLAKPKITREEIAQRPLDKRAVITIGAAFFITFAFDRLICSIPPTWLIGYELPVFWIICALTVTALHWKTARKQVLVWLVLGSIIAIGVWNMLAHSTWCYSRNDEYALTTQFVQPTLLMLHCQLVNGRYDVRRPLQVVWNWFTGWLQQPFIHIRDFAEPFSVIFARFAVASRQRSKVREIGIALLISIPLLLTIIPLLVGDDQIVQYEVLNVFRDFNPMALTLHIMFIVLPWPLLFSLLISLDTEPASTPPKQRFSLSSVTAFVVLAVTLMVYALFCTVQVRFLFAGLLTDGSIALPDGLTYSEYARSGFFQLLAVTAINVTLFGLAIALAPRTRTLNITLVALLALTAVILASAALRLGLYINAYGLTWLRYLSASFIALLATVILLCLIRLKTQRLPLAVAVAVLLIVWYVALGFSNPNRICEIYNAAHGIADAVAATPYQPMV